MTGADLEVPGQFNLVNPASLIATVADGGQLDMTIRIGVGRGYVSAERNKRNGRIPSGSSMWTRCSRRCAVAR